MIVKCRIGDIVTLQKSDFPVMLRKGPGYSHNYVCPESTLIVLDSISSLEI